MTTGVTMPSLRPLSTLRMLRTIGGTAGLVMTAAPSAASVGARAAPTSRASQTSKLSNMPAASSQPMTTVSGRAKTRSRTNTFASARSSAGRTREASENSTQTRVTSVISWTVSRSSALSNGVAVERMAPTATNTMGAVKSARCNRADTAPHANTAAAMTATVAAVIRRWRSSRTRPPDCFDWRLEPEELCLLGGELLFAEDALVLEGGELLELFDLRALGGLGCGWFWCGLGRNWGSRCSLGLGFGASLC